MPTINYDQLLMNKEYSRRVVLHRGIWNQPFNRVLQQLFSVKVVAYLHQIPEESWTYPTLPPISKGVGVSFTKVDFKVSKNVFNL